jgi:hypothetical protein
MTYAAKYGSQFISYRYSKRDNGLLELPLQWYVAQKNSEALFNHRASRFYILCSRFQFDYPKQKIYVYE